MGFRQLSKSVTVNNLDSVILRYFIEFGSFGDTCVLRQTI